MTQFVKEDLSGILGKHLVYTYDTGWKYEIYIKNKNTIDYRIHSGLVANRWVKDQHVDLAHIAQDVFKVSWSEPTGTNVSVIINLPEKLYHGTIYFPRWIMNNPEKTVCFQNDFIPLMQSYRDAGPTYPIEMISEFATITFARTCAENDERIIDQAPQDLPDNFPNNLV